MRLWLDDRTAEAYDLSVLFPTHVCAWLSSRDLLLPTHPGRLSLSIEPSSADLAVYLDQPPNRYVSVSPLPRLIHRRPGDYGYPAALEAAMAYWRNPRITEALVLRIDEPDLLKQLWFSMCDRLEIQLSHSNSIEWVTPIDGVIK